jgi:hypothetical protein
VFDKYLKERLSDIIPHLQAECLDKKSAASNCCYNAAALAVLTWLSDKNPTVDFLLNVRGEFTVAISDEEERTVTVEKLDRHVMNAICYLLDIHDFMDDPWKVHVFVPTGINLALNKPEPKVESKADWFEPDHHLQQGVNILSFYYYHEKTAKYYTIHHTFVYLTDDETVFFSDSWYGDFGEESIVRPLTLKTSTKTVFDGIIDDINDEDESKNERRRYIMQHFFEGYQSEGAVKGYDRIRVVNLKQEKLQAIIIQGFQNYDLQYGGGKTTLRNQKRQKRRRKTKRKDKTKTKKRKNSM